MCMCVPFFSLQIWAQCARLHCAERSGDFIGRTMPGTGSFAPRPCRNFWDKKIVKRCCRVTINWCRQPEEWGESMLWMSISQQVITLRIHGSDCQVYGCVFMWIAWTFLGKWLLVLVDASSKQLEGIDSAYHIFPSHYWCPAVHFYKTPLARDIGIRKLVGWWSLGGFHYASGTPKTLHFHLLSHK